MRLHDSNDITKLIYKHYGFTRATPNEIKQQMLRVAKVLSVQGGQAKPDPKAGKVLFTNTCFDCHKLHNEGKSVGPDLTGYERTNLDFMLQAIIDPSAGIREEYINYIVRTIDGRVVTGFLLDQSTKTITMQDALGGAGGGKVVIPRGDIDDMRASKVSRMPQKLLDKLTDKQIRDLFAYLTSN
jgi:putative heme-binding domain-containing protein